MQTKFDILQAYKKQGQYHLIRDSWHNLGANIATTNTKTYIKDLIYKVDLNPEGLPDIITTIESDPSNPTSLGKTTMKKVDFGELHGAYVLCEVSIFGDKELDWKAAAVEDSTDGLFSFSHGIISPHFRLLLDADEAAEIVEEVDTTFTPYGEMKTSTILIDDDEFDLIMLEAGVPFILMEELEFTKVQICDTMIKPAIQEYFKFFPIIKPAACGHATGTTFEVEVPEGAYGAVRAYITQGFSSASNSMGNPLHFFANEIVMWGGGSSWGSMGNNSGGSPGYSNLTGFNTLALNRAARQGINNYSSRFHFRIERKGDKKVLIGFSNKFGLIEVHWAYSSNNWRDIEYARLPEVRKLATSKVLRALGMLRGQVASDVPGKIDYASFISRAETLEKEVYEFWNNVPQVAMIRGSM